MKKTKAALSVLLALVMLFAVVPMGVLASTDASKQDKAEKLASTNSVTISDDYSSVTLESMTVRAEALVNYTWTPSADIETWNGNEYNGSTVFSAGSTVTGVPYTLFTSEVVSWSLCSLEQYRNVASSNYSTTKYCNSVSATRTGPVYGSCCVDLVCEVFGGNFMNGSSPRYHNVPAIRNSQYATTVIGQKMADIKAGDAVSDDPSHSHIIWVGEVTDTQLTIYEQTPPVARKVVLDKAACTDADGYFVYGSKQYSVITRSNAIIAQGTIVSQSEINAAASAYGLSTSSNAYSALQKINDYYDQLSGNTSGTLIFFFEGVGNNSSASYRMNAMCVVIKAGLIKYVNLNSSTIPDYPFDPSKNEGTPMPTVKSGVHNFTTVNHKGQYAALNITTAPVLRHRSVNDYYDGTSYGINIHRRSSDNIAPSGASWVNSSGCVIVGVTPNTSSASSEYARFIQAVGIVGSSGTASSTYSTAVSGKVVIDRSYADQYFTDVGYTAGARAILGTNSNITPDPGLSVDSSYPTPFNCRYVGADDEPVYSIPGGSQDGYLDYNDDCVIEEVYTNGWCKVTYPISNGTRTKYIETSKFIHLPLNSNGWMTAPRYAVTYLNSDAANNIGWVDEGDSIYRLSDYGSMTQVVYPANTSTGKRCGWVYTSSLIANTPSDIPTPFNCRYVGADDEPVYNTPGGSQDGYLDYNDDCIIEEIYTNGWCKVTYPIPNGTRTRYIETSKFIHLPLNSNGWMTAPRYAVTYLNSDAANNIGWIDEGDSIYRLSDFGSMTQVIYPANTSTGKRCGWVYSSELVVITYFYLDINGMLDGAASGSLQSYGTFDVYINGSIVADDVNDYYTQWPAGTSYEIKDIKPNLGYSYVSVCEGSRIGTINGLTDIRLSFETNEINSISETPEAHVYGGHTYYAYSSAVSWFFAKEFCEANGGHLVTIGSAGENSFVHSIIPSGVSAWLGGTDYGTSNSWRWITGESFQYNNWNSSSSEPNESPNEYVSSEDYAMMYSDGTWNDCGGYPKYAFVLEVDSALTHTVTFKDWDGTVLKTENVVHGSAATAPADPTRAGYSFIGWDRPFDTITANTVVTAQYSANTYTVSYNYSSTSVPAHQYQIGDSFTLSTEICLTGYNLYRESDSKWLCEGVGWKNNWQIEQGSYIKAQFAMGSTVTLDSSWVEGTAGDVSFKLYPVWAPYEYQINFDANGGSGSIDGYAVPYGGQFTLPGSGYAWDGHDLMGWNVHRASDDKWFTVERLWETEEEIIANGHSKNLYGLNTTWGLTASWITGGAQSDTLTFYAIWDADTFTVTFKDWDGTVLKTQQVEYGSAATAPADPVRDGYTFTGWDVDFSNVTSDLIVTAQYEQNTTPPANAVQFSIGEVNAVPGSDVSVDFCINGEYEASGLTVYISYDADKLTFNSITKGQIWYDLLELDANVMSNTATAGSVRFMAIVPSEYFTTSGTIFTMNFRVKDDVELGTDAPLTIDIREFFISPVGGTDTQIPFVTTDGAIHVNYILGDVNGDGEVNGSDVILVMRYALGMIDLDSVQQAAADYNKDGQINASDALAIMRKCLGII